MARPQRRDRRKITRIARPLITALACAAAFASTTAPAEARSSVDLTFTTHGGSDGLPVPAVGLAPSLDPTTLPGELRGTLDGVQVTPGSCTLSLTPGLAGSGAGTLNDCANTSLDVAFDYVVTGGGAISAIRVAATNGGAGEQMLPWSIDCYFVFPPGVIVCKISLSSSA